MSSDSQRPPPQNALQRRLASQPPPADDAANADKGAQPPDWRSDRFAELAAAEASEFSKPDSRVRGGAIARAGSRAASGAVHGLASASAGTARATAAGVRGTATAAASAGGALARGLLKLLDLLGGAVIAVLRALGRGSLALLRASGRGLRRVASSAAGAGSAAARASGAAAHGLGSAAAQAGSAAARGLGAAAEQAQATSAAAASATGGAASRGLAQGGSALWARRRTIAIVTGVLAFAAGALFAARAYAPDGKRAALAGGTRVHGTLVGFGSSVHATLADLGLVEPIPEAADKPDPPPRVPRFVLEVVSVPEGATASFAGQELTTPALFELDVLPEPPLRVAVRKAGLAPVVRRLDLDDFAVDGPRARHSLRVTLREPTAAEHEQVAAPAAAEPAAEAPKPAAEPARDGPTQLVPSTDVPAAPF